MRISRISRAFVRMSSPTWLGINGDRRSQGFLSSPRIPMIFVMMVSNLDKYEMMNGQLSHKRASRSIEPELQETLYFGLFRHYNKPS